jgi:putative two-component system hydrogenase maturation factor HypX/HoxX
VGDRGASSIDWAILNNEKEWGVTVLQASEKMDAGTIWATATFPMRNVSKSHLYRHEVTQAAMVALLEAIERFEKKNFIPVPANEMSVTRKGKWNRSTCEDDFSFSWNDDSSVIKRKINAADSFPGAGCSILGDAYYGYGVQEESMMKGVPGTVLARRNGAVCIATKDKACGFPVLRKKKADLSSFPPPLFWVRS